MSHFQRNGKRHPFALIHSTAITIFQVFAALLDTKIGIIAIPMILVLLGFALFLFLGGSSPVIAPFVYTVF